MSDLAVVITAIGGAFAAVIGAIASLIAVLRTGQIHREVRTMNELTIGQLGEAGETRRIAEIAPADRTAREDRHMAGDILRDDKE